MTFTFSHKLTKAELTWALTLIVVILALLVTSTIPRETSFWWLGISLAVLGGIYLIPASIGLASILIVNQEKTRLGEEPHNDLNCEKPKVPDNEKD